MIIGKVVVAVVEEDVVAGVSLPGLMGNGPDLRHGLVEDVVTQKGRQGRNAVVDEVRADAGHEAAMRSIVDSETRGLDYFSIFGPLQQRNLAL